MRKEDEEHLKKMSIKKSNFEEYFSLAEAVEDIIHPDKGITIPANTTVLITMISRFGDVGIRATNFPPFSHGYDVRVYPEMLQNYRWAV